MSDRFVENGDNLEIVDAKTPTPAKDARRSNAIAFDKKSKRRRDENGFMHIDISPISKEMIREYYGQEIPGWDELGLDPEKIYRAYCPAEELEKAVPTFNGLNILSEHVLDSAEDPPKELIVGSMGTDAEFRAPYLLNSLIIKDEEAIKRLAPDNDGGTAREISASYRYDPDFSESGKFNGQSYDFVMRNIRGNHIALVEEGRAGHDVVVSDSNTIKREERKAMGNPLEALEKIIAFCKELGISPHPGGEKEAAEIIEAGPRDGGVEDADPVADPEKRDDGMELGFDDMVNEVETMAFADLDGLTDELQREFVTKIGEAAREYKAAKGETEEVDTSALVGEDETCDADPVTELEKGAAMDKKRKAMQRTNKQPAMDMASIERRIHQSYQNKAIAARDCRGIVETIDPLAFDSAASIYKHALAHAGHPTKTNDIAALRQMVGLVAHGSVKNDYRALAEIAQDSASGELDENFAHLDRVRKG